MKVSDLIRSSAFVEQNGIILEIDIILNNPDHEAWYLVHWLSTNASYSTRPDHREWVRPWEIELRDIS
jgi:hypothetical protein